MLTTEPFFTTLLGSAARSHRFSDGLDMKIPGSDAVDNKISRPTDTRAGEQSGVHRSNVTGAGSEDRTASAAQSKADTIKVSSLGALLQSELNPAKMADERAQKIAKLKEQIQNGTYASDSQSIARSMSEEIYLEIALAGDFKE
jgi:flagellar biosynthesis anti-sigma factor FlgM